MNTTDTTTGTNNLIYSTSKHIIYDGVQSTIYAKVRLNDECKNGHQDFSITGEIYRNQTGNKHDRYFIAGGCIHDEIYKYFKDLRLFIKLHLSDFNGAPMYATENGFYHLKNGFQNTKGKTLKEYFCEYYRTTPEQFEALKGAEDQTHFSIILLESGVIEQWKQEAKEGIKLLEQLTGKKFINDSTKSNYTEPTPEQIKEFKRLVKEGYYTEEAKLQRKIEAFENKVNKLVERVEEETKKAVKKANMELTVVRWFINYLKQSQAKPEHKRLDFDVFIENYIYYTHSNTLAFNWKSYSKEITPEQFKLFCDGLKQSDFHRLPTGIKFTDNKTQYSSN